MRHVDTLCGESPTLLPFSAPLLKGRPLCYKAHCGFYLMHDGFKEDCAIFPLRRHCDVACAVKGSDLSLPYL